MYTDGIYKGPDGEALRFYEQAERNAFLSDREGRPIYDTVLMVEVTTPGSRECTPHFILETKHAEESGIEQPTRTDRYEKYKGAIEAYRAGSNEAEFTGTPLTAWPALDTAQIAALREARIFTVDGLAALSDEKLRVLGPSGRSLRDRAAAFLSAAAGNAPMERLATENEELRARIAALEAASAAPAPADAVPHPTAPAAAPAVPAKPPKAGALSPIV